jgi:hypothetical protein
MIKRIREMAWSMKLAVLFLLACSITLFYFVPAAGFGFTFLGVLAAAVARVIKYSIEGE